MSIKFNTKWIAVPALTLALAGSLLGNSRASAATLALSSTSAAIAAGTPLSVSGASFTADEWVGLWINVPAGAIISPDSLGQNNSEIVDNVVGLDNLASADDDGNLVYNLNTDGLPSGNYSLVAHGLSSGTEEVLDFTVTQGPAIQLTADTTTAAAGTILRISGASYQADEPIGVWLNVPAAASASIPSNSLGQDNSEVVDNVVGLDNMGSADDSGAFTYTLDTTGLPSGTYSLVAHGLLSGIEQVLTFTIQ